MRLTIGCSHLPPASNAVQPNGGALGKCEWPEPGRNCFVGWYLVSWHRRPGCRLRKKARGCEKMPGSGSSYKLFTRTAARSSAFSPRSYSQIWLVQRISKLQAALRLNCNKLFRCLNKSVSTHGPYLTGSHFIFSVNNIPTGNAQ